MWVFSISTLLDLLRNEMVNENEILKGGGEIDMPFSLPSLSPPQANNTCLTILLFASGYQIKKTFIIFDFTTVFAFQLNE